MLEFKVHIFDTIYNRFGNPISLFEMYDDHGEYVTGTKKRRVKNASNLNSRFLPARIIKKKYKDKTFETTIENHPMAGKGRIATIREII